MPLTHLPIRHVLPALDRFTVYLEPPLLVLTQLQSQGQSDELSHVAAVFGILVLGLLGGVLFLRNRLAESSPTQRSHEPPTESLLTDRERVCSLIEQNGGRMKQSAIVDSVDWSKAKVSRLLAELEDDDEITKLRLGRENLVCIRGNEPSLSQSSEPPSDVH
ncbi:helix-turn-helix transcriptional regulator [Natronosalvus vescus]|uniref:helix-turn-helix transcriptional regulator n=1 Tax=Natronosalvus vescus TaxID=2953881 RepID=UPI002091CE80|nr:membrane-associated protein/domain-like protein [Natronosalvus vescus]